MTDIQKERIDPHLRERRERIAAVVLAQLAGNDGKFRPEHIDEAVKAADALIVALDSA